MSSLFLTAMQGLTQGLTQFGELQRADIDRKEKARQQALAESMEAEKLNLEKRRTRTAEDIAGENILASQKQRELAGARESREKEVYDLGANEREYKRLIDEARVKGFNPEREARIKQLKDTIEENTLNQGKLESEANVKFTETNIKDATALRQRQFNDTLGVVESIRRNDPQLAASLGEDFLSRLDNNIKAQKLLDTYAASGSSVGGLSTYGSSGTSGTTGTSKKDALALSKEMNDVRGDMAAKATAFLKLMAEGRQNGALWVADEGYIKMETEAKKTLLDFFNPENAKSADVDKMNGMSKQFSGAYDVLLSIKKQYQNDERLVGNRGDTVEGKGEAGTGTVAPSTERRGEFIDKNIGRTAPSLLLGNAEQISSENTQVVNAVLDEAKSVAAELGVKELPKKLVDEVSSIDPRTLRNLRKDKLRAMLKEKLAPYVEQFGSPYLDVEILPNVRTSATFGGTVRP